jgi:hypothetical protein
MDGLAIGMELDVSGIGDMLWVAAADGCPDEHAAAASASTEKPTALRNVDEDMNRPPWVPASVSASTATDGCDDVLK